MRVTVNGKEIDLHGLVARAEARAKAGLYSDSFLALLGRDIRDELHRGSSVVEAIYDLDRVLQEKGIQLEPPADLAREGEQLGRWKSLYRRAKTRFIRAVNEGYVQQQERFNSFLVRGIDLAYLQLCDKVEGFKVDDISRRRQFVLNPIPEWDEVTVSSFLSHVERKVLVITVPGLGLLRALQERGLLALALDLDDSLVARAQGEFLPVWYSTTPLRMLGFVEEEVGAVLVAEPGLLTASELVELVSWSADRLPAQGKVFMTVGSKAVARLAGEEACFRGWPLTVIEAVMELHGFSCAVEELGNRRFVVAEASS